MPHLWADVSGMPSSYWNAFCTSGWRGGGVVLARVCVYVWTSMFVCVKWRRRMRLTREILSHNVRCLMLWGVVCVEMLFGRAHKPIAFHQCRTARSLNSLVYSCINTKINIDVIVLHTIFFITCMCILCSYKIHNTKKQQNTHSFICDFIMKQIWKIFPSTAAASQRNIFTNA